MDSELTDYLYFIEDIAAEYSKRRKGVTLGEAKDLIRCTVKYINKLAADKENYSMHLPYIGLLYTKFDPDKGSWDDTTRYNKLLLEYLKEENDWKLTRQKDILNRQYGRISKEELQKIQNSENTQ